jgi:regulator of protease activity HflC (stomatin/prohibitin superfamily)
MLFMKFMFLMIGIGAFACAVAMVGYDIYLAFELNRLLQRRDASNEPPQSEGTKPAIPVRPASPRPRRAIHWQTASKLAVIGAVSLLARSSIVVIPDGDAGVRISQISGVRPGTLYAGTHFIFPLRDRVELYDIREKVFSSAAAESSHEKLEVLTVESREGLPVGLAVTVRYRIDPRRLDYIQSNLPQPIDEQIVAPVVLSAFHEMAPNYMVRDIFSTKREEFRQRVSQAITTRLAGDAINVKEVLLRKVDLPEEYAKGLEDLLLKEQDDDQTSIEAEIEQKRVKIAESQAEAAKVREVKHAEGDAQSRVIMAKADSDAMQYTLPLKQKQIEQSRLEAEARKEATIQNADAEAQAKVIDSKAEQQRQNLLADAEANRIHVTGMAQAEQMQLQAAALKVNPLLVQYTVAEKLSDKVQIMLVPNDGKFFFTNNVLQSAMNADGDGDSSAGAPNASLRGSTGLPGSNVTPKR